MLRYTAGGNRENIREPIRERRPELIRIMARHWWVHVVRGILAVLFGLAALFWPGITLGVLVLLFGVWVLIEGVLAFASAFQNREETGWWILLLEGLAGVVVAVCTFVWPLVTAQVLLVLIAAWALATGILEIVAAIRLRREIRGEWVLGLGGVLSILIGLFIVVHPAAGALAVVWAIGLYAILFGGLLIFLGVKLRKLRTV